LRLSGAIWMYWATRGHWTEGRRFLSSALALDGDVNPELLVDAFWGAAILAVWQGDVDDGEQWAMQLLELSRKAALPRAEAVGVHTLAMATTDRDRAQALYEESLVLARSVDDGWLVSAALNNLGSLYLREAAYERAIELFEESLAIGEARGDLDRRARELTNLGHAVRGLGDLTRARAYFRSGLAAAAEIGLIDIELDAVWGLASYEAVVGDVVIAARLVGWVNEQIARLGASADTDDIALEESLRGRLGPERLSSELAAGAALTREDAIDLAVRGSDPATPAELDA
jgi:tetratricopeptide (TPR) repeat protein